MTDEELDAAIAESRALLKALEKEETKKSNKKELH
jgi:hypothetical protein